jgi:serine protease AprX
MATKRVIAYTFHENEHIAVGNALDNTVVAESYVIGDIEETRIDDLRGLGVLVEDLEQGPTTTTLGMSAEPAGVGVTGGDAEEAAPNMGVVIGGGGAELAGLSTPPPLGPRDEALWTTKLSTPLLPETRKKIDDLGLEVTERIAQTSFLVRGTREQADELIKLDEVADVTMEDPAARGPLIATAGANLDAPSAVPHVVFDVRTRDETARDELASWLDANDVKVLGAGGKKVRFELEPTSPLMEEIARRAGSRPFEYVEPVTYNDIARRLVGIAPAQGATFPYTGKGQVVAVADTGFDDSHPDLKGQIVSLTGLGGTPVTTDAAGHGTHVAGSILGDGSASGGQITGMAPGAKLYGQAIGNEFGRLTRLPVDLNELLDDAYAHGARIHNDSWGSGVRLDVFGFREAGMYTDNAQEIDEFVFTHPDMVVVIAAGNDGTATDPFNPNPGMIGPNSVGAPASSKNAITVGASRSSRTSGGKAAESYVSLSAERWPSPLGDVLVSGDPEALALFSSRGPCDDDRIKPDVVAPGTDILSTRASGVPSQRFWGEYQTNGLYAYMGGTSMATPIVAGCAALVREFYESSRHWNPSAALVKATLINGTKWLTGKDAIAGTDQAPNSNQGFGMIHMPTTLPNPGVPGFALTYVDTWNTPLGFTSSGERFTYEVDIADSARSLRICLTHTDRPGRAQQCDIFLVVEDPALKKYIGNQHLASGGTPDKDNNTEAVRIEDPAKGTYRVLVVARNLLVDPGQKHDFALVASGGLVGDMKRVAN